MPDPVVTPHADTARQSAQAAEAGAREKAGTAIPAGETSEALAVAGDTEASHQPAPRAAEPAAETEPSRPAPKYGSLGDEKRAAIIARFRTERTETAEAERDDVSDFTRSGGMPEEFREAADAPAEEVAAAAEPEPAAPAPAETAPAPEPQLVEVTVRGEKKMVPLSEALSKAQIAYAADNYLDEARNRLESAKSLENEIRATRSAPSGVTHPTAPNEPQTTEQPPVDDPSRHPESPVKKLVEAIQFGDPAEAETLLVNTIREVSQATANQELESNRIREDAAAAKRALDKFKDDHKEIAEDPMARAAIEQNVLTQQVTDLSNLGVDLGKIRKDGRPATPADVSNYHQILRSQGHNVRSPGQLLEAAHSKFLEWKGIAPKPPQPAADDPPPAPQPPQQQRTTAPRVEISVERQARRQAAPQQPARPPAPVRQPEPPRDRSDVVKAMQERRAAQRGQTLGVR